MDIQHVFWTNPMRPAYRPRAAEPAQHAAAMPRAAAATPATGAPTWVTTPEGVYHIGAQGGEFAFDNEGPAHRVFLEPYRIASRLVTNGEYLQFIEDGGYERPGLWLSAGLATVQEQRWVAPLYWEATESGWDEFTLRGQHPVDPAAPVCHVSYYEADAYARWAGRRLPTEAEWEVAAALAPVDGSFVESEAYHPAAAPAASGLVQLYGEAWQWTQSAYVAYPGYVPAAGAIGEYNGKWMADQWVLRGASCATPRSHARRTYRNFFPSGARWHFSGIRLADNAS